MADRWKPTYKKWTLAEAQKLGTLGIARLTIPEKAELAQFYYRQFNLRANSFVRSLRVPYAFSKIMSDFDKMASSDKLSALQREISLDTPIVKTRGRYRTLTYPFSNMENPGPALNNYIRRMQAFFNAKSSTIAGWNEVSLQQDIQLFGANVENYRRYGYITDENGKRKRKEMYGPFMKVTPKYRMTDAERIKFWAVVDLAKDAGWLNRFGYSSTQAHRQIASLWQNGTFDHNDIDAAYTKILEILGQQDVMRGMYPDQMNGGYGNPLPHKGEGGSIEKWSDQSDLLSQDDSLLQ